MSRVWLRPNQLRVAMQASFPDRPFIQRRLFARFTFGIGLVLLIELGLRPLCGQTPDARPLDPPSIVIPEKPRADLSSQAKLKEHIANLLKSLESASVEVRTGAEKDLIEIGSPALSYLPKFASSITSTYREAVERVRDAIQSQAINDYAKPSLITLSGKFSASDVLIEVMEQSDNQLSIQTLPSLNIDVDFRETLFWEALDRILDDLNLDVGPQSRNGVLDLVPGSGLPLRTSGGSYAGVFRLEPLRVDATRTILPSRLDNVAVSLEVSWEPRLRPVFFRLPMSNVVAECDNGELLGAVSVDAAPEYIPSDASSLEAAIMLTLPSRDVKKILRLSGSLVAAIPGAPVQVEFDQLDGQAWKDQQVGKLRVRLDSAVQRDDIYEFSLKMSLADAGQAMDSFRGWMLAHQAYLVDKEGKRIEHVGMHTNEMNSDSVGLTYFFDVGTKLEGYRLVYVAPGAVIEQHVDFILRDIPLP